MSQSADIAITTLTSILIITCIVGNSLVCAIIKRNRGMRLAVGVDIFFSFVIKACVTAFNHVPISRYCHNNTDVHTHHNMHRWKLSGLCHHQEKSGNEVHSRVNTKTKISLIRLAVKSYHDTRNPVSEYSLR